jgi:AraC family transcriptional regulator
MKTAHQLDQVRIVDFPATRIAVLEHRGDPRLLGDSIRKFIEWRKQNHLPPKVSATFNIVYGSPTDGAPEDYRLDLGAATDGDVADNPLGIACKTIPGGRCAVLRHIGSSDLIGETVSYLYRDWLPDSGEDVRDFPLYFQRVKFFPDVPENEAITDVFLPLK